MEEQNFTPVENDSMEIIEEVNETVESVADDQPLTEESEIETGNEESPLFSDDTDIDLGEGRNPVKFAELKSGYLRQSDYTKKTQALSEERKAFESERAELEPVRGWLDHISSNPYLYQQINQAIQEWENTGVLPIEEVLQDAHYGKYINHLMAENTNLTQRLQELEGKTHEYEVSNQTKELISELKAEFGDLVSADYEQDLIQQAKETGYSKDVLKRMAKGDLADLKIKQLSSESQKTKQKVEAETIKKIQQNAKASTGPLGQEAEHKTGFTSLSKEEQRAFIEKVKRGEIRQF